MAHALTTRKNGKVEMAFTGDRSGIWHELGQELTEGAPIETWITEAGMDWEVFESPLMYQAGMNTMTEPSRRVLFRSDTSEMLSVVSDGYKIVQPREVLEFFRDLTEKYGMKLSTAGTLFGGRRFWALAKTGNVLEVVPGDIVENYVLISTSTDGSLATGVRTTSTRVVCNNTLTVALKGNTRKENRTTHHAVFDADKVKLDMGLIEQSWYDFGQMMKRLTEIDISDNEARKYFEKKIYLPNVLAEDQPTQRVNNVNTLMGLYTDGAGANYSRGTLWGVLNAATDFGTHGNGRKRDSENVFWSSYFGNGEKFKNEVLADMMSMAA